MPSTVIRDHHYEPEERELTISFATGRIYVYRDVPEEVYADFSAAFSKGSFFNKHIRDHYPATEVMVR